MNVWDYMLWTMCTGVILHSSSMECKRRLPLLRKSKFWYMVVTGIFLLSIKFVNNQKGPVDSAPNLKTTKNGGKITLTDSRRINRPAETVLPRKQFMLYDPMKANVPLPFLEDYRNPCFYEELETLDPYASVLHDHRFKDERFDPVREIYEGRLERKQPFRVRCFPHFFIAGVQKCGTTDLQHLMSLHHQIAGFSVKEIHWWNRSRFNATKSVTGEGITMEGYLDLFDTLSEKIHSNINNSETRQYLHPQVFGDTSPAILWDQGYWQLLTQNKNQPEPVVTVANDIKRILPQAKFIIILRNPIDRLYSDWHMFGNARFLGGKSPESFHKAVVTAVDEFDECVLEKPLRTCFYNPLHNDPVQANKLRERHPWWNPLFRLRMGMYYIFIKDLFSVFPRHQVFILRLEDYSKDRIKWLNDIFSFLGLDPDPTLAKKVKYEVVYNRAKIENGLMLPETLELLNDFYGEYNRKLAKLLQNNDFLWENEQHFNMTFKT